MGRFLFDGKSAVSVAEGMAWDRHALQGAGAQTDHPLGWALGHSEMVELKCWRPRYNLPSNPAQSTCRTLDKC